MSGNKVLSLAKEWLQLDVNPSTREQIQKLVDDEDFVELDKRLSDRIVFGTAGLRARMEAGFGRINDVTILQASQGLAKYLISKNTADKEELTVVIGHDHRHNSERYANLTASAFLHYGFKVYFLGPGVIATPIVPFAVDHYGALGGVMITSSHNPKEDNGYKVYWGNGCQIIPPHDRGIQDSILVNLEPFFTDGKWDTDAVFEEFKDKLEYCKEEIVDAYIAQITSKLISEKVGGFKAVYTPMHGVGAEFAKRIEKEITDDEDLLVIVPEQEYPDPEFPTVSFPNPEEKGALDLAIATAESLNIPLVLANDPDADRFSAAVKVRGKWRQLTGNEIGFLFAQYVASKLPKDQLDKVYMVNSTVSSQMIASMAKKMGFNYTDTLTGFKWIGNKAIDLEKDGYLVPFGFEEAIGFMFTVVHDKDGLSALAVFLQMYQQWQKDGTNAISVLERGFKKYGYFTSCNGYYRTKDVSVIPKIFNQVIRRKQRTDYPSRVGDYQVLTWRDLTLGFDSSTKDGEPVLPVDSSTQMITCTLRGANENEVIRFTARGSGTEPKLKVYIEARSEWQSRSKKLARAVWDVLKWRWFRPGVNELTERIN
ncbi:DEKNAAC102494 [Brettanomyces naardenensis]|uniref:DEKNAAC102494 n=1 Tax=Brettanomyces naardenensis TaxID=13370 RepID=A0A448YKZ1_BRENA|nr:DEKNAAC102494 [Brettanomyces naardenensis]